jgi:hypothetical protein
MARLHLKKRRPHRDDASPATPEKAPPPAAAAEPADSKKADPFE